MSSSTAGPPLDALLGAGIAGFVQATLGNLPELLLVTFAPREGGSVVATLLIAATFIIVIVGLSPQTHDPASSHVTTVSAVAAAGLLLVSSVGRMAAFVGPALVPVPLPLASRRTSSPRPV